MATVTPGITFVSGETVTPAKLNSAATPTVVVADAEVTTAKIADGAVTAPKLASGAAIPAGAVMPFAMNSAPTGWLAADGAAVSRSTYADLFAAVGTAHGAGDGSTTFNLPDLRGIFVRGSGDQTISGTTYSKTFAAKETDALIAHTHQVVDAGSTTVGLQGGPGFYNTVSSTVTRTTTNQSPAGDNETRPANIALLYCVKF